MKLKTVDGVTIDYREKLPDGVTVLYTCCYGYDMFKALPKVVEVEKKKVFCLTGWNSDRGLAYYRDYRQFARRIK